MNLRIPVAAILLLFAPNAVAADTASRLLRLLAVPGVAGYEHAVREAIELALPMEARVRADNMGNIVLRTGRGEATTLVVAPLDEGGLVVSAVTADGYLRAHRHTTLPGPRLATQFVIGQPVEIRTAGGAIVPGVTATPSMHLRSFRDPVIDARIKALDDVWIDVGAESAAEVEALGVRMLDSITLRERATGLAGGRVSGVGAGGRAAALALAEMVRRRAPGPMPPGAASIAWVVQSEYGNRGLLRLLETVKPTRVILLRAPGAPGEDPAGAIGRIGDGPIVAAGDDAITAAATSASVRVQTLPAGRLRPALPARYDALPIHVVTLPVLFAQTPVETVDARDVEAMAQLVAGMLGFGQLKAEGGADGSGEPGGADPANQPRQTNQPSATDQTYRTLGALIEAYGVSGHEGPVRDAILARMPAWAKPDVDERGNVRVTFGNEDGPPLVFVAHLDEVGFEIARIGDDGRASVRARGGMDLSIYEAHPLLVHTPQGPVGAVLAPRTGYPSATTAHPQLDQLTVYFGTATAAETRALGVAEGQSATVRKQFVPLAGSRATGRAMDDRNGSTALLLALQTIDPSTITSHVRFAWAVEEETGLAGAAFMAERSRPDAVFAIDTFVSSDTPVDGHRLAGAQLGKGAVLRGLDSRTLVRPQIIDRIVALAKRRKIPMQIGVTSGGTDASAFNEAGAIDIGLSWPGRYSHSPVEVMDRRDLEALVQLIVALAMEYEEGAPAAETMILMTACSSNSDDPKPTVAAYGTWTSPLTAARVTAGSLRFDHIVLDGDDVYWIEGRASEGGRNVIVRRRPDGHTTDVTPVGFNARSRVHEYGGAAYTVHRGTVFFSNFSDQRLYRQAPGGAPEPLTPEGYFYADGVVDAARGRLISVREDHTKGDAEPINTIVSVAVEKGGAGTAIVSGADFYSDPILSLDGGHLAWLQWNHPNMPWDGTDLWVAEVLADGSLGARAHVAGGHDESIFQPEWSPDGTLYFVSDRTGWWNLYRWSNLSRTVGAPADRARGDAGARQDAAGSIEAIYPMPAEFGKPQWTFSASSYAFITATRLAVTYSEGGRWKMALIETEPRTFERIGLRFEPIDAVRANGRAVYFIGGSPTEAPVVARMALAAAEAEVLRTSSSDRIDPAWISVPEAVTFSSDAGSGPADVHAFYYAPKNPDFRGSDSDRPPLLVLSHGGPTGATSDVLDARTQFWTSRGFAVLDVNYSGSTGYGRGYRDRLKGQWGVADVADSVNGAKYLVAQGKADPGRLIIRGGSAGGYTTLAALTFHQVFKAGASYYGISDIEVLARDTHKFESRYLDSLVGPYPAAKDLYLARSPIHFTDRLSCALILFQGLEDKVVPPNQSEMMADAVRRKGLPVAYVAFPGEQHGFRREENIIRSLEAELYFYGAVFEFPIADRIDPVTIDNLP